MTPMLFRVVSMTFEVGLAPWWGVPVVAGSFLLFGAVLGFVFNRANDKRRAELDAEARWREVVRTLTAAIFAHAARIKDLARENAELYDEGLDDSVPFKARVSRKLWDEQAALQEKASEVSIIVPLSFAEALFGYVGDVNRSVDDDKIVAMGALKRLPDSHHQLMREVRSYLGLMPQSIK